MPRKATPRSAGADPTVTGSAAIGSTGVCRRELRGLQADGQLPGELVEGAVLPGTVRRRLGFEGPQFGKTPGTGESHHVGGDQSHGGGAFLRAGRRPISRPAPAASSLAAGRSPARASRSTWETSRHTPNPR